MENQNEGSTVFGVPLALIIHALLIAVFVGLVMFFVVGLLLQRVNNNLSVIYSHVLSVQTEQAKVASSSAKSVVVTPTLSPTPTAAVYKYYAPAKPTSSVK